MQTSGLKSMHIAAVCAVVLLLSAALVAAAGDTAVPRTHGAEATAPTDIVEPDSTAATAAADSTIVAPATDRVVLYYFHRTARCHTCLWFEANVDSLVQAAFQPELSEGVLEWHAVNLDEDGNEAFVERYALEGITLLSTVLADGEEREWRSLEDIWWFVDDREAFADYVASEIRADLGAIHGEEAPEAADSLSLHGELLPKPDGGGMDSAPAR